MKTNSNLAKNILYFFYFLNFWYTIMIFAHIIARTLKWYLNVCETSDNTPAYVSHLICVPLDTLRGYMCFHAIAFVATPWLTLAHYVRCSNITTSYVYRQNASNVQQKGSYIVHPRAQCEIRCIVLEQFNQNLITLVNSIQTIFFKYVWWARSFVAWMVFQMPFSFVYN